MGWPTRRIRVRLDFVVVLPAGIVEVERLQDPAGMAAGAIRTVTKSKRGYIEAGARVVLSHPRKKGGT
jgi:hypothetical protein